MTFATQSHWGVSIALYLFLGGMGAAGLAIAVLTDLHRPGGHRSLALWGVLGGIAALLVGSLLLFVHLLDPAAVYHVLNPMAVVNKPDSWIAWGTQFIVWTVVFGLLYIVPHLTESPLWRSLTGLGPLVKCEGAAKMAAWCRKTDRFLGWVAAIMAFGTAVYTGFLLQSFPAVALWHNPGTPVLFTISAFSTGLAFLLLGQHFVIRDESDTRIRHLFERWDAILIGVELLVLAAFSTFTMGGSRSGTHSWALLWGDWVWVIGFLVLGLIVPLALEIRGNVRPWRSPVPVAAASILVLVGGYLLRHYFLAAGVYVYPW